jgi:hypothetical protein
MSRTRLFATTDSPSVSTIWTAGPDSGLPGVVRLALVIVLLVTTSRKKPPKKILKKEGKNECGIGNAEGGMGKRAERSKLKVRDRG